MVKLVNKLTVTGDPVTFEEVSDELTSYMRAQPGYLRFELLKSLHKENVYLEIAEWTDAESHLKAVRSEGFLSRVRPLGSLATVDPDVYEIVRSGEASGD